MTKNIGKPCTGKPYARFDEGALRRNDVASVHVVAACGEASCKGPATTTRISALLYLDIAVVVMPDGAHRRNTAKVIYRKLAGMGFSKDIVVVTEGDIRKNQDNQSLVIYPALRKGKELYHAT